MNHIFPRSLLILTLLSLLFSSITFVLSLVTYAIASLWLGIIASALTVLYHTTILVISWRRAMKDTASVLSASVSNTWPGIIYAAFILGTWILALAVTLETTILGDRGLVVSEQNAPWNDAIQVAHSISLTVQVLVFTSVLIYCISSGRVVGSSAEQPYTEEQPQLSTIYGDVGKSGKAEIFNGNNHPTTPLKVPRLKHKNSGNEITPFPFDLVSTSTRPSIIAFEIPLKTFSTHNTITIQQHR